jgi:hypothetical protein
MPLHNFGSAERLGWRRWTALAANCLTELCDKGVLKVSERVLLLWAKGAVQCLSLAAAKLMHRYHTTNQFLICVVICLSQRYSTNLLWPGELWQNGVQNGVHQACPQHELP